MKDILTKKKYDEFNLDYLGSDNDLPKIFDKIKNIHIGIGQITNSKLRKKLFQKYKSYGFNFPVITSSSCIISKKSFIDEGTIIMEHVYLNADTKIGSNCIINNKALIEHGCIIGNNCHISTGAIINGDVKIGDNVFIGSGAIVNHSINIGNNCFINSGKVINNNLENDSFIK